MRKLPALFTLQTFEAAARYENFSQAAQELHVTHGAVSRQIRSLEEQLGAKLFSRNGPSIALTDAGRQLLARLSLPLHQLHHAVFNPISASSSVKFTLYTLPSIAATWLLPNISQARERWPDMQLSIVTDYSLYSLPPNELAAVCRYGTFKRDGLQCTRLAHEQLVFAATQDWFARFGEDPSMWPAEQCLEHHGQPWPKTLAERESGHLKYLPEPSGTSFNDALLQVMTATQGVGVAWTRYGLVRQHLRNNELQVLDAFTTSTERAYWFAAREEFAEHIYVKELEAWLVKLFAEG